MHPSLPVLDTRQLESELEARRQQAQLPGLAVGLVQEARLGYAAGFGVTSVEEGVAVTPRTVFRIGSLTKPLVGTAVMRLVQRGLLELDRPVREQLPWLEWPGQPLTLRHLLSHQGGLPLLEEESGPREPSALEPYLRQRLAGMRPLAPVGRLFSYSNAGLALVARVMEVAAGVPFAQLMEQEVFAPLGMGRTTFELAVAATYPLAQSHRRPRTGPDGEPGPPRPERRFAENAPLWASGFAFSTVEDLAAFSHPHLTGGLAPDGQRYLAPELVEALHQPQVDLRLPEGEGYALTFFTRTYLDQQQVLHKGNISGFAASLVLAPQRRTAVILLANCTLPEFNLDAVSDRLFAVVNGLPAPEEGAGPSLESLLGDGPPPVLPPRWEGDYFGPMGSIRVRSVPEGGGWVELAEEQFPIIPLRDEVWVGMDSTGEGWCVAFVPGPDGRADHVLVQLHVCARVETAPERGTPQPERWAAHAGHYQGHGQHFVVRVEGQQLLLRGGERSAEIRCVPLADGRFCSRLGLISFSPAAEGQPARMTYLDAFTLDRTAGS